MNKTKKQKRHYRRITSATVAKYKAQELVSGNGTKTIEVSNPEYQSPHDRAYRIRKKSESMPTMQYIDDSLQQIGAEAVQELSVLVHSDDEAIRTRNVHYAIDHIRGKAVTKNVTLTGKMNIQSVLD